MIAAYRILLHLLIKYPGPLAAKLTDAYNGFFAYRRRLHLTAWQNQQKYGSVVRQGPNKLVFNSVRALKDIYRNDQMTKPRAYMAMGPGLTSYTVFTATDRHLHRARRQLIGQVLTDRSMRAFEPIMIEQVDIYLRRLLADARSSTPVNMTERSRQLGLNIAGLLGFGYDLGLQTEETNQFMLTMLEAGTLWSDVFLQWPGARMFRLGLVLVRVSRELRGRYLSLIEKMIRQRTAMAKDAKHDLYSYVADALDEKSGGGLRQSDLWAESNLFLTAAGDTTKTALSGTFFYLSRNPDAYRKLSAEIQHTFQNSNDIRGSALAGCRYLRACIDESLRLSSPAPGTLWRELGADSDAESYIIDGHLLPRGTVVGVNIYSIHHNPEYFPDPFSPPTRARGMADAFTPFLMGPRGCAGKTMAYMEVGLVIAKTLWYFDFEPSPEPLSHVHVGGGNPALGNGRHRPDEFQLYDVFTALQEGPYLSFRAREGEILEIVEL
ncbi:cytochrome P450 [Apiospora marii]|uniref:Cytochrome P450 n=1 Tax=Apiospora marii TaxID=335849 RepID=A0ABR1RIN7_9PEZI